MDGRRLERALRQGPPFATRYAGQRLTLDDGATTRRSGMRPLVVLLVAALLTAVAVGAAISIGSGLWRLPFIDAPAELEVQLHYYRREGEVGGIPTRVPEATRIHARLPDGWVSTDSSLTNAPDDPDRALTITFWAVALVFHSPCDTGAPDAPLDYFSMRYASEIHAYSVDPPLMRSLDWLADAFTTWSPGDPPRDVAPDGPTTTEPASTTVSGFRAEYLELRVPDDVDPRECVGGRYVTWMDADGVERQYRPGDVSRIWIVEAGPEWRHGLPVPDPSTPLLVIDATSRGEPSAEATAELAQIIDSLRIEAPEPWPPSW